MSEHPLTPILRKFFSQYFKISDVQYSLMDEHIREPHITFQGTKPSKKGQTIYCLTFKITELEREITEGEGLETHLSRKLCEVFEIKDLSDYFKVNPNPGN